MLAIADLPAVNATLNVTSAVCVLCGYGCIRQRWIMPHKCFMIAACVASLVFFISYGIYHAHVGSIHFKGTGWIRPVYFSILISHTMLAIVIVPVVIRTLFLATRNRLQEHRRLARVTLPLWLYVSVTGVIVYWMLYHLS